MGTKSGALNPVVGSAHSLIRSIKNGTLGRSKKIVNEKVDDVQSVDARKNSQYSHAENDVKSKKSRMITQQEAADMNDLDLYKEFDGVNIGVNSSEDEYHDEYSSESGEE